LQCFWWVINGTDLRIQLHWRCDAVLKIFYLIFRSKWRQESYSVDLYAKDDI
jgi:hypothetical protein